MKDEASKNAIEKINIFNSFESQSLFPTPSLYTSYPICQGILAIGCRYSFGNGCLWFGGPTLGLSQILQTYKARTDNWVTVPSGPLFICVNL
jgi:hypothetical protein